MMQGRNAMGKATAERFQASSQNYEASVIEQKLAELGWNQTRAAEELRISRRALIDKMKKKLAE